MGGYEFSYESFETFVKNQSRLAKHELDRADEVYVYNNTQLLMFKGQAEARKDVVLELAKYLNAPEAEVERYWEEATK